MDYKNLGDGLLAQLEEQREKTTKANNRAFLSA